MMVKGKRLAVVSGTADGWCRAFKIYHFFLAVGYVHVLLLISKNAMN